MTNCNDCQQASTAGRRRSATSLILTGAALLAALILACSAGAAEYRAFWVDGWGAGFLNQSQVDTLLGVPGNADSKGTIRDVNCNMVIVQVRRRFDVCYPSGVGEPYMSGLSPTNFNALAAMIKAAHDTTGGKKRIEVHCWSVAFKTANGTVYSQHSDTPTGSLTEFDNYWPTRVSSTTGAENGDGAFDPGHPKALEYLVNAHMDLVNFQTTAGPDGTDGHIDGIHYDYIRFEGNTEGFNPTSVARYNARYGLSGDPASSSEQFKQWRRDQVTAFARQMYARIQKTNPRVKQSGSFVTWNPSPTTATRVGFQATRPYYDVYSDWDSWQQEGIMDMAVPMTYYNWASLPNDYTRWMNFEKDRHGNRHMIIGPGIYLNSLANAINVIQLTRNASPSGNYAHGFSGYSYRVPYANGTWSGFSPSLVSQVTPTWADIPEMPWKLSPTTGHIMGVVTNADTGIWADGATVSITGPVSRSMYVDGTGFYTFIDLPPGSYNVTANLSGYPDVSTNVSVAVGAVTGNMYEQNLVIGAAGPPTITRQPQLVVVLPGQAATFSVTAVGSRPLSYQWRVNGQALADETNSVLSLPVVSSTNTGAYSVLVTNIFGETLSADAALALMPVTGWGDNGFGQGETPEIVTNAVAIAAGAWHTLALRADGGVAVWGDNSNDQCLMTLQDALAIAAGGYHNLAIRANGKVVAWGANDYGQTNVPAGLSEVIGIAAGTWHSVALRANGTVAVWGDNSFGQTNLPSGLINVTAVAAGGNHTLALKADGTVVAWGENTDAEGRVAGQSVVPWGLTNVAAIGAGQYHSLALKRDGTVVAWGDNAQDQCNVPLGLTNVVAVAGGGGHSLALGVDGALTAWGADWNNQCDIPPGLFAAVGIAAGSYHTAVLLEGVTPVPQLLNPARKVGQFSTLVQTLNRKNYALEYKDSLAAPDWTAVCTNAGNGALKILTDQTASGMQRFYRMRQW